MKHSLASFALSVCLAVSVVAPASGYAAGALPDEIVDPASAIAPQAEEVEIAALEPAREPAVAPRVDEPGPAAAVVAPPRRTAAIAEPASPNVPTTPRGSLPFTGIDSRQLVLLSLVGSLLLTGGVTAILAGRPAVRSELTKLQ